ncbi:MAG: ParA family protein, partial [Pseudomonadota bacterium]
ISASQADVWATQDVIDLAERAGKPTHIVMNRMRAGTRVGQDVAASVADLDAHQLTSALNHRVIYAEAMGRGLGVVEVKRTGAAADEMNALAHEVSALLDA